MATDMYFSVGTSTADLKTTGAQTDNITGGIMGMTEQTGNIGVGDCIDYDTDNKKVYIVGKISRTQWRVRNADGSTPADFCSVKTINSIKRTFNSLAAAINGSPSGTGVYGKIGSSDLTTHSPQLRVLLPCYADGTDVSFVMLSAAWVTNSSCYFMIYAPTDTVNEVNQSQRHNGIVGGGGYTLRTTGNTTDMYNLTIGANYTKVYGLKVVATSSQWQYRSPIGHHSGVNYGNTPHGIGCEVAYCLVYLEDGAKTDESGCAIEWSGIDSTNGYACSIHDNFIVSDSSPNYGIFFNQDNADSSSRQCKLYNNSFYGQAAWGGFRLYSNTPGTDYRLLCKNNYSCDTHAGGQDYRFHGGYANTLAVFDYNASDDGSAGTSNHNKTITLANAALVNTSASIEDLHLQALSALRAQGIGPGSDGNVSQYDIDGNLRSGNACDIGADEVLPVKYADKQAFGQMFGQIIGNR